MKLKIGDEVKILAGKNKGKTGKVVKIFRNSNKRLHKEQERRLNMKLHSRHQMQSWSAQSVKRQQEQVTRNQRREKSKEFVKNVTNQQIKS